MKNLIAICFASFCSIISLAQSPPTMLSQSRYRVLQGGGVEFLDSVEHSHSNGRVSYGLPIVELTHSPNDGVYNADESIRVAKNLSSSAINLVDKMTRQFNSAGLISEYHEQTKISGVLTETFKEVYAYNASNQPDTIWTINSSVNRRHTYIYQNGIQRAGTYEDYDPQTKTWELVGVDSFLANGTDSTYVMYWKGVSTMLQGYLKHKYQRDANFRVMSDSLFQPYNIYSSVTYSEYDVSGRKILDSVYMGSLYSYKKLYLYDNNGNLVSVNKYTWNSGSSSYTGRSMDTMTYNPVNQLTSVRSFTLSGSTWAPEANSFSRFYYYGFPAGIADVAEDKSVRLYPVPATSYINLDITFSKPEVFAVTIYNMQGQAVRQWKEPARSSYSNRILLDGMPAGNYLVHIQSESKNMTRQFSVIN